MVFKRKAKNDVEQLFKDQFVLIKEALEIFDEFMKKTMSGGECNHELSYKLHKKEHEADEKRREIQVLISGGAFLPFYREDFISLSEIIDEVTNQAKSIVQDFVIENPKIPDEIKPQLDQLVQAVEATFAPVLEILHWFFTDTDKVFALSQQISACEQEADAIQWKLMKDIFALPKLSLAEKLQLKTHVSNISGIADQIEDAADKIRVIISKQKI